MRVPLLIAVLLPSLAAAQGLQLAFTDVTGSATTTKLTTNDCSRTVRMQYSGVVFGAGAGGACGNLRIWASEASCGDEPGSAVVIKTIDLTTAQAQQSGKFDFPVSELPVTSAGVACGAEKVEKHLNICGAYKARDALGNCDQTVTVATAPVFTFDTVPPDAPGIAKPVELDQELRVTVTAAEGDRVRVEQREAGTTNWIVAATLGSDVRTLSITGLRNGTTYELQAIEIDQAGNEGPASAIVTGTPIETIGFWGTYKKAGGEETGGCTAAGGMLAPLAVLSVVLLRRRRS